ncbi:hypothetical protein DMC30DRAFT_166639 [Rhodotorula diobovata]|uniref:Uncharacterized protein n=1 Tax=Rhodotorula diobovata TaxID=5288 RepID=A0A5C5G7P2_9BASI|nr:hypothetical protein DMC30DRAFT_166639 [Rhodotorula diobovata]
MRSKLLLPTMSCCASSRPSDRSLASRLSGTVRCCSRSMPSGSGATSAESDAVTAGVRVRRCGCEELLKQQQTCNIQLAHSAASGVRASRRARAGFGPRARSRVTVAQDGCRRVRGATRRPVLRGDDRRPPRGRSSRSSGTCTPTLCTRLCPSTAPASTTTGQRTCPAWRPALRCPSTPRQTRAHDPYSAQVTRSPRSSTRERLHPALGRASCGTASGFNLGRGQASKRWNARLLAVGDCCEGRTPEQLEAFAQGTGEA